MSIPAPISHLPTRLTWLVLFLGIAFWQAREAFLAGSAGMSVQAAGLAALGLVAFVQPILFTVSLSQSISQAPALALGSVRARVALLLFTLGLLVLGLCLHVGLGI